MARRKPKSRAQLILDGEEESVDYWQMVHADRTHRCVKGFRIDYRPMKLGYPPMAYHRQGV